MYTIGLINYGAMVLLSTLPTNGATVGCPR